MTSKVVDEPIVIDARAAAYAGESVRVLALVLPSSGRLIVKKQADWKKQPTPKDDTVVVTDTPMVFDNWDMSFDEETQMREVIRAFNEATRSGLVVIEDALRRYNPGDVIQMRKMDESGKALDFDSFGVTNGHMAVLLAIWAARKIHGGHVITNSPVSIEFEEQEKEEIDSSIMPFSL